MCVCVCVCVCVGGKAGKRTTLPSFENGTEVEYMAAVVEHKVLILTSTSLEFPPQQAGKMITL